MGMELSGKSGRRPYWDRIPTGLSNRQARDGLVRIREPVAARMEGYQISTRSSGAK